MVDMIGRYSRTGKAGTELDNGGTDDGYFALSHTGLYRVRITAKSGGKRVDIGHAGESKAREITVVHGHHEYYLSGGLFPNTPHDSIFGVG